MKNKLTLRSPLFYVGDKFKLIDEIKNYFPSEIKSFVEPFVGGGSVFLNVDAENFILNDIDKNVIALHKFLCSYSSNRDKFIKRCIHEINKYGFSCSLEGKTVPVELKLKYKKTYYAEYNREAYLKLREDYNKSNRRNLFQLYLLLIYGFNHMIRFNLEGNFNLPVGNVDFNQNVNKALQGYFENVEEKNIQWSSLDFKRFFEKINLDKNDFVYLDPPYLITFSEYNKFWNSKTECDLLRILDVLNESNVKFAISNVTHYKGKENKIFIEWARKYNSHSIKSNYISYHDNSIKNFQEVLVTNY